MYIIQNYTRNISSYFTDTNKRILYCVSHINPKNVFPVMFDALKFNEMLVYYVVCRAFIYVTC